MSNPTARNLLTPVSVVQIKNESNSNEATKGQSSDSKCPSFCQWAVQEFDAPVNMAMTAVGMMSGGCIASSLSKAAIDYTVLGIIAGAPTGYVIGSVIRSVVRISGYVTSKLYQNSDDQNRRQDVEMDRLKHSSEYPSQQVPAETDGLVSKRTVHFKDECKTVSSDISTFPAQPRQPASLPEI